MRGKPKKGSCAIEILSFQNFYEVLKTCSAGRKDFFNTLTGRNAKKRSALFFYCPSVFSTGMLISVTNFSLSGVRPLSMRVISREKPVIFRLWARIYAVRNR